MSMSSTNEIDMSIFYISIDMRVEAAEPLMICLDKSMILIAPESGSSGWHTVFSVSAIQFYSMKKVLPLCWRSQTATCGPRRS